MKTGTPMTLHRYSLKPNIGIEEKIKRLEKRINEERDLIRLKKLKNKIKKMKRNKKIFIDAFGNPYTRPKRIRH